MSGDAGLDRLIGRLLWVGVRGCEPGDGVLDAELDACAAAHVGGVILFDVDAPRRAALLAEGCNVAEARQRGERNIRSPEQTRRLVNHIQDRLGARAVVCVDQEGGPVARLNPARGFAPTASARQYAGMPEAERRGAAAVLAETVAGVGIDLNLAPCVDVGINADSPGLGRVGRLLGRDPRRVAMLAQEQIAAMHARGVSCAIKHFPGLGSAEGDTHLGLVDITETFVETDELAVYAVLLSGGEGPDAVMMCHAVHRGYDAKRACSLSSAVIGGLLRGRLGYDGLVLTDSLDMRAIADRFGAGEAAVLAIEAGADVALEANNLTEERPCPALRMHRSVREGVESGRLSVVRLERSVERLEAFLARHDARRAEPGRGVGGV